MKGPPLALLILAFPLAAAGNPPSHVKAELIVEQDSIKPGGSATVGVRLTMKDGWHTYWRNPGDTGMATTVDWKLPPGFKAEGLQWPYPTRFVGKRSVSYGYADEAVLLLEIRAPAHIKEGPVTIAAKAQWLECKEICIPGEAELSIAFPAQPAHETVAAARRKVPVKLGEGFSKGAEAKAIDTGAGIGLGVTAPLHCTAASDFFPFDNDTIDNKGGGMLMNGVRDSCEYQFYRSRALGEKKASRLAGVFTLPAEGRAVEISVPVDDMKSWRENLRTRKSK
ncbi:MAG: hypothetical protein HY077_02545 [Elusimicrobia bacterium]|nr:hypothetical protein [Elusimicrobiota bacterium]